VDLEEKKEMLFKKRYGDKEVECQYCHRRVYPLIQLNRMKSEFYGCRYSVGNNKPYLLVCPKCKAILGTSYGHRFEVEEMSTLNLILILVGVIIFVASFLVNSQPSATIFWFLGIILVFIGLYYKRKVKQK